MKVEQDKADFREVIITLESQDEVDQLFALVNFTPVTECLPVTGKLFTELKELRTDGYRKHFNVVEETICEI